jgi:cation diffusion facilitator CzcD-associated flavoprotein CzcO
MSRVTEVDVLIVGAGISGIDAAYRISEQCPELSYLMVDRREQLGGTWDLFRYPGIRSDSDIFTLAYPFFPWTGKNAIVDGDEILSYLSAATAKFGIDEHMQFGTRVHAMDWVDAEARWTVEITVNDVPATVRARFVVMCTGYYDYDHPYDPGFTGTDDFGGTLIHPQFWPADLEVDGRRVTVIGSGATAVTLVPSLAAAGAQVTMLQRTPSYVMVAPRRDAVADRVRRMLPAGAAHQVIRAKNTAIQMAVYQACRRAPGTMRKLLRKGAITGTGSEAIVDEHFNPPYDPWDQRLCVAPQGDLFRAIRAGNVGVVTASIDRFEADGIRLTDGSLVEADIVITATGLSIQLLGGVAISVDGVPVNPSRAVAYRGAMLSGLPNLAFCLGYINLSWTMRADMTARLVARILRRMVDSGNDRVTPVVPSDLDGFGPFLDMQSGYIARAADTLPRATKTYPWAMAQNFVRDAWATYRADLDDGLEWSKTVKPELANIS